MKYWNEEKNKNLILEFQETGNRKILNALVPYFEKLIEGERRGNNITKKFSKVYLESIGFQGKCWENIMICLNQKRYNPEKGTAFSFFSFELFFS